MRGESPSLHSFRTLSGRTIILGRKDKSFANRLVVKLAGKWQKLYSQVCGYMKAKLSIAAVRATHLCLRHSLARV